MTYIAYHGTGAGTYTLSLYVKANGRTQLKFTQESGGDSLFTLSGSGTAVALGSNTVSIASVGNGWYRCSSTFTTTGAFGVYISLYNSGASNYTGDGVSGIYIWGAQFSRGVTLFTYIPTTTAAVYSLPIDHDPITHAPLGVLIEEQRTNLLTYSEQFDNAAWAKGSATVTANAITAPDGTTTADKIVEVAATATHNVAETVTIVSATVYTYSVYAKAGERSWLCLEGGSGAGGYSVWFDLATGAVGTVSGTSSSNVSMTALENGWYRCVVTDTSTSTTGVYRNFVCTADNTQSYAGDGTSGLYLWGAQLEAGAFATSYIPTVASQVTRAADQVSILTSAFAYNAAEGSIVANIDTANVFAATYAYMLTFSDGTNNERIVGRALSGSPNFAVIDGGVAQVDMNPAGTISALTLVKIAVAYKANDFAAVLAGGVVSTDGVGSLPTVTTLYLGAYNGAQSILNGHIKRLTYWNTRKTNAELQGLTI